jgi:hypothetical protein
MPRLIEILVYALFPAFVALGVALGASAATLSDFVVARMSFITAAAICFGLAIWLVLHFPPSMPATIGFLSVGVIGAALLLLALSWVNEKASAYCEVVAEIGGDNDAGPYTLTAVNSSAAPIRNVSLRIHAALGSPPDVRTIRLGDIEAREVIPLDFIKLLAPGRYQIDIRSRTGNFVELLDLEYENGKAREQVALYRSENDQLSEITLPRLETVRSSE